MSKIAQTRRLQHVSYLSTIASDATAVWTVHRIVARPQKTSTFVEFAI
jgi:hypothetical protein